MLFNKFCYRFAHLVLWAVTLKTYSSKKLHKTLTIHIFCPIRRTYILEERNEKKNIFTLTRRHTMGNAWDNTFRKLGNLFRQWDSLGSLFRQWVIWAMRLDSGAV